MRIHALLFLLSLLAAGVQSDTNDADAAYLHRFAAATGADFALNWSSSSDPCQQGWLGLICDGDGRVQEIDLNGRGLRGTVPGAEGDGYLAQLTHLDLGGNTFTGDLPLLLLPELEFLHLDGNGFTGMPPGFFAGMRKLETFSISNNPLRHWTLPDELRNLTQLMRFNASSAGVNGTLPEFLGSSSPLYKLDLANNSLRGPVPEAFQSGNIDTLDLSNNNFSGQISFLTHLPNIIYVRLSNNSFTGALPDFSDLISLKEFNVAHNMLTGVVPALLPKILTSGSVSLSGNLLQGPVPEFGSQVREDVAEAADTGCFCRLDSGPCDPVVDSLLSIAGALNSPLILAASWRRNDPCAGWLGVHCTVDKGSRKVTGINLSRLALNGTMDPAFASILSLESIVLSGNNITGVIPPAIAQLPSVRILDLSDNAMVGRIPRFRRDVEVWAEGNRGLYSVAAPIIKASTSFTLFVVIVAFAF